MAEVYGTPPEPVCTFTASLACVTCKTGALMSWRAEESPAEAAEKVMEAYRQAHKKHTGYREGIPAMGLHAPSDSLQSGDTIISIVGSELDPNDPSEVVFTHNQSPTIYRRTPKK